MDTVMFHQTLAEALKQGDELYQEAQTVVASEPHFHRMLNALVVTLHELRIVGEELWRQHTVRTQEEHALREDERFARSAVDALSASIAILDDTGTIIRVNQAWRTFAEANAPGSPHLTEGANYLTVCDKAAHEGDPNAGDFAAGIRAVMKAERETYALEYACHSPYEQRWFIGRVTRFPGLSPLRIVVAHENITARKLTEEQLKERERLAAIGSTAAMFAHQVGNPLNSMSTTMQLLERRLARGDASEGDTITTPLRHVGQEIQRLTTLLGQFRFLARPQTPHLQPVHLASFVGETLAIQALDYAALKVVVEHAFPPDLPPILADRERLKQALFHLCENAVEAMPQGGTLTFRASATEGQVSLDISDTGVGAPRDVDIFAPFVTTKAQGSGLGLTVVRQIISAHDGAVTYQSTPGQGSTFTLTLPVSLLML